MWNVSVNNYIFAVEFFIKKIFVIRVTTYNMQSFIWMFEFIKSSLRDNGVTDIRSPKLMDFRAGDVRHSQADISKAKMLLGYEPNFDIKAGIVKAMPWYVKKL